MPRDPLFGGKRATGAQTRLDRVFAQQIEMEDAAGVGEEDRLAAVATLGDVVRGAGDYDAGEAGHGDWG